MSRLLTFLIALQIFGAGALHHSSAGDPPGELYSPPPFIGMRINNGIPITNLREVPLELKSLKLEDKLISEMRFGFSPELTGSDWLPYTSSKQTIVLNGGDGVKTIFAQLKDKAGNLSPIESADITLDTEPPKNCSVSVNGGSEFTNDRQMRVVLDLLAEGAIKMQISNEETFDKAVWEEYSENKRWLLAPAGDGVKTVYGRFMDAAKNISPVASASIILDTQPPSNCSVTINDNQKYITSNLATLSISAAEAEKVLLVDNAGSSEIVDFSPDKENVMIKEWRFDSLQGAKVIKAYFMDAAQNKTPNPAQDEIIYDSEGPPPPMVAINNGAKYTNDAGGLVSLKIVSRVNPTSVQMLASVTPDFEGVRPRPFSAAIDKWELPGPEDGKKAVYIKLLDEAGNSSETAKAEIILDREPPEVEKIILNEGKEWVASDKARLELQVAGASRMKSAASEAALRSAPWEPFRETIESFQLPVGDGEKTIYFRFKDEADNMTDPTTTRIKMDTEPPRGAIIIEKNQKYTNKKKIDLHIRFDDAEQMMLSDSPDFTGAEWRPAKTVTENWELAGEDGKKAIYLKLRDKAGNESENIGTTVALDRNPPSKCKTLINNGARWLNNPSRRVTLSLFAEGAYEAMVSNNPDFGESKWFPVKPTIGWTLENGDGEKEVYVKYRDEAGNESPAVSASIRLDTQPPIMQKLTVNGGKQFTNHRDLDVELAIKSEGAHFFTVSNEPIENAKAAEWRPYQETTKWRLSEGDGAKTVFVLLQDSAGNITSAHTANVIADRTPPTGCRIIINNNDKYANHPDKKVSLLIAGGDATEMMLSNNASFKDAQWEPAAVRKQDWVLPGEDGEKVVFAKLRDAAGNVSEIVSDQIQLDRKPPKDPGIVINKDSVYATRQDRTVNLKLSAQEAKKMMIAQNERFEDGQWEDFQTEKQFALSGGDGKKEVFVKFRDEAGNETQPVSDEIIVDFTSPKTKGFTINNGEEWTNDPERRATLLFDVEGAAFMMISEDAGFKDASWQPYQREFTGYKLSEEDGEKKIYAQFKDEAGNLSETISAVIKLKRTF